MRNSLWLTVLICCFGCRIVDTISVTENTNTTLMVVRSRISTFYKENGRLPDGVSELPADPQPGRNDLTDAWGRQIEWVRENDSTIRLRSLGRDGVVGGAGDDADLESYFYSNSPTLHFKRETIGDRIEAH